LRVGIDDQASLTATVGERGKVRGERAFARSAFARRQGDDVHAALRV
jgi:hypothetical protein